ncbi:serine hydrolase [Streptomyces sp. NPDC046887]|uniref:serine hydrolase n=1 Tax=Streptomyces sp. NPDC046887 TaxID=3155472 RepID=UPI00340AA779
MAAWVGRGDNEPAADGDEPAAGAEKPAAGDGKTAAGAGETAADDGKPAAGAEKPAAGAGERSDAGKPDAGKPDAAEPAEDAVESAAPRGNDTAADSDSDSDSDNDGDGDGDEGRDGAGGRDGDEPAVAEAPARPEAKESEPEGSTSDDSPDAEADADADAGEGAGAEGGKKPVDQPTAIFRAVQRTAPPVDQPTTMLKTVGAGAGAARKQGGDSARGDRAESRTAPESAAEGTSKFVPLRTDDVRPAARKPEADPTAPEPTTSKPTASKPAEQKSTASKPAERKPAEPKPPVSKPVERKPAEETAALPASLGPEQTRQQPLPPRPPLDLLAELTNTPPPPETPVRTAVRRVKIWTPLVLLLAVVFAVVQAVRPLPAPTLELTAKPTFTFDGGKPKLPWPGEGQGYMSATGLGTVDSFGEQKPVPIASVTKAMTAYVILRDHPIKKGTKGPMIEVDALAEKEGGYDAQGESTVNTLKEGDKISLHDAIAAIMIPSANNVARLLARWDAGSEQAFVKKMNAAAKELGMTKTTYTDPSGLTASTVSTAEDQVKLGEQLVEIPALMKITVLPNWTDPSGRKWRNWNDLVPYNGALGIKTGSTTKAGGNLLFAAHKKVGETDQLIVGAVLAQYKTPILGTAIAASKEAMIATQDLLKSRTVVKKGDVVGRVDDGLGGTTPVVATKDVSVVGWSGLTVKLELSDGGRPIPHSAAPGTPVGSLTVGEGASQVKVPVAVQGELAEPGFGAKLTRIS